MGTFLLSFLAAGLVVYALLALGLFLRQRSLQYRPTKKDALGKGSKVFKPWVDAQAGFLGYVRPQAQPRRVVVFFHGSRGEALDRQWVAEVVPASDLLVLAEYPGFGARQGKASEAGIYGAAQRLVEQLRQDWPGCPVVAIGEGLGAAVASRLAAEGKVDELALIAPYRSGQAVAARRYPFVPVKWFLKDRLETLDWVARAQVPLHVVHGTLDEDVPLDHGRAVYAAATTPRKTLDEVPGFGHANLEHAILHSPYTARFRAFLAG